MRIDGRLGGLRVGRTGYLRSNANEVYKYADLDIDFTERRWHDVAK